MLSTKRGFTLIELLVVISIIGLLSAIVLSSLSSARSKARDSKRISEIKQLQTALELYYEDNDHYPITDTCGAISPNNSWCHSSSTLSSEGYWIKDSGTQNVLSDYISKGISDPKENPSSWAGNGYYNYGYYSNAYGGPGQWYMIVFKLENTNHPLQNTDGVSPCSGSDFDYGITNPNKGIITLGVDCRL